MTEMASHAWPGARSASRAPAGRSCSRTSCRTPATASLSFRYATSQVWLVDLVAASDPSLYDLCPEHADALTVPRGWERVDERSPVPEPEPEPEPVVLTPDESARHRLPEGRLAPHSPDHRSSRPPNRYAALSADLPLLAAQVAATAPSAPERAAPERAAPEHGPSAPGHDGDGGSTAPPTFAGSSSSSSSATSMPTRPTGARPTESRPSESRAADARPSESRAADARPSESRAADARHATSGPRHAPIAAPTFTAGLSAPRVRDGENGPDQGSPNGPDSQDGHDGHDGHDVGPPPEVDGQLALGVDLLAGSPPEAPTGAVVVPIGEGARRRQGRATDSSRLD